MLLNIIRRRMKTMLDDKMEGALPSEPMENGVSHRLIHPAPAGAEQSKRRIEQKRDELTEIIIAASEEWLKLYGRMHLHLEHKAEHIAAAVSNAGYRKQSEGEWVTDEEGYVTCSNCGEEHTWDEFRPPYCDMCGAKMKGGEGE